MADWVRSPVNVCCEDLVETVQQDGFELNLAGLMETKKDCARWSSRRRIFGAADSVECRGESSKLEAERLRAGKAPIKQRAARAF